MIPVTCGRRKHATSTPEKEGVACGPAPPGGLRGPPAPRWWSWLAADCPPMNNGHPYRRAPARNRRRTAPRAASECQTYATLAADPPAALEGRF
jgi:hypothetical protein